MTYTRRLTGDQKDQIRARRAAGEPAKRLAEEYGVTRQTIHNHSGAPGWQRRYCILFPDADELFTTKAAAEWCGVTMNTIRFWIHKGLKAQFVGGRIGYRIRGRDLADYLLHR